MATEADTCRKLITPKLQAAGWETDPHSITEQYSFTDGRIVVRKKPGVLNEAQRHIRARAGSWDGVLSGAELLRRTRP